LPALFFFAISLLIKSSFLLYKKELLISISILYPISLNLHTSSSFCEITGWNKRKSYFSCIFYIEMKKSCQWFQGGFGNHLPEISCDSVDPMANWDISVQLVA